MQNEKNSNWHWKQKLNDADFIPTEARLNKDVAWQKLQQRLHKPKRKKAILYWAAAACLLPHVIVLLFVFHTKKNNVVNGSVSLIHKSTKALKKETKPLIKDSVIAITKLSKKAKNTVIKKNRNNIVVVDTNKEIATNKREDANSNNEPLIAVAPSENMAKTNIAIAVKPKLKVIHINELGEPVEDAPIVAHNVYPHSFSMQIGKEEVYANPAKTKSKNGFINLPITSSSN